MPERGLHLPQARTRWLIEDFLDAHATHEFFDTDEAVDTAAQALQKNPGAVHPLSILLKGKSDRARAAVAQYLRNTKTERAWSNREHDLYWKALQADQTHLGAVLPLASERFLAGDYRMTPYLVLAGEAAHPTLQEALKGRVLDRRMVAVAVLKAQKEEALALLTDLESMGSLPNHAQAFLEETLAQLRALR